MEIFFVCYKLFSQYIYSTTYFKNISVIETNLDLKGPSREI